MRGWRATVGVVVTVLVVAAGIVGLVLNLTAKAGADQPRASEFVYLCNPLVSGPVAGFLVLRRPRHPAGWLLGLATLAFVTDSLSKAVLHHATEGAAWTHGLAPWAAWLDNWTWIVFIGAVVLLLLRFPDGKLPSRRWRPVQAGVLIVCAGAVLVTGAAPTNADIKIKTAIGWQKMGDAPSWVVGIFILGVLGGFVSAVVSLIVRRRGASGAQRAQLRWVLWSGGLIVATIVGSGILAAFFHAIGVHEPLLYSALDVSTELSPLSPPIAIMVAVSRHGLFEIDRVISRTLGYTILTALLGGIYVVLVTSASLILPDRLGSLPVAAATLAVAALFVPVRRWVTRLVDRRFNRSRYDADQIVADFADRVRGSEPELVTHLDLVSAVQTALQPAHASVWLVPTGRS